MLENCLALSGRYPNQIRCVLEELNVEFEDLQLKHFCDSTSTSASELLFNLLLSFCFIGDVGYDPDDVHATSSLAVQTNAPI